MQLDVSAAAMTMSERADALEEHKMHELEHIITKSVLFNLADGKVETVSGAALPVTTKRLFSPACCTISAS